MMNRCAIEGSGAARPIPGWWSGCGAGTATCSASRTATSPARPRSRIAPRRAEASRDDHGRLMSKDVADGGGEAGEQGVELDVDLIAERSVLADQVAAMTGQQPELGVDVIERRLGQAEAVDGGSLDGGRSVSSVLLPGSAGKRNCLEARGWTTRASNPAADGALDRGGDSCRCVRRPR